MALWVQLWLSMSLDMWATHLWVVVQQKPVFVLVYSDWATTTHFLSPFSPCVLPGSSMFCTPRDCSWVWLCRDCKEAPERASQYQLPGQGENCILYTAVGAVKRHSTWGYMTLCTVVVAVSTCTCVHKRQHVVDQHSRCNLYYSHSVDATNSMSSSPFHSILFSCILLYSIDTKCTCACRAHFLLKVSIKSGCCDKQPAWRIQTLCLLLGTC